MNWFSFGIAFVLLVILPVWVIKLVDISFKLRVIFTIGGAVIVYWSVLKGGAKRGFITR